MHKGMFCETARLLYIRLSMNYEATMTRKQEQISVQNCEKMTLQLMDPYNSFPRSPVLEFNFEMMEHFFGHLSARFRITCVSNTLGKSAHAIIDGLYETRLHSSPSTLHVLFDGCDIMPGTFKRIWVNQRWVLESKVLNGRLCPNF